MHDTTLEFRRSLRGENAASATIKGTCVGPRATCEAQEAISVDLSLVECCFMSTETVGLLGTGVSVLIKTFCLTSTEARMRWVCVCVFCTLI